MKPIGQCGEVWESDLDHMLWDNAKRKPDAGNPHAWFDEEGMAARPSLYSTEMEDLCSVTLDKTNEVTCNLKI